MSVVIETTIGDITVDLFTDERPVACLNFIKLCKLKYYNYNLFHTIEQGFIAQTGDPTGVGDGGASIWGVVEGRHKRFFEGETLPKIHHNSAGLLSLVGAGKHLVGSQFFFTLGDNLTSLDGQHCVIGEVVEGHEVLRQLNEAIVDDKFRPYQDIRITHTVLLDDPFADPRGFREPSRSPSPSAERLKNGRIAADEDIDDTDGKTMEEIQEMLAEREAKARATILEIVGDLPDADMAPPENVLFVCKLNPVTSDDDLEIIFSRFGKVKSCEVIRDRKSGDSLQYAFVEFEEQKSCEAAYFKMDNVLIDDRRIHVDFSQSVSKIQWKGKGRGVEGDSKALDFNNLRGGRERNSHRNGNNRNDRGNQRQQNARERRQSRSRSRSRERVTSAERRKAREERHREQEKERKRSKSRHRTPERRDDRRDKNKDHRSRSPERRRNERPPERKKNEKYSPERQRNRNERNSPERRRNEKYSPERERNRNERKSPERRRNEKYSPERQRNHREEERQRYDKNYNESRNSRQDTRDRKPAARYENERSRQKSPERREHDDEKRNEKCLDVSIDKDRNVSQKRKADDDKKKIKKSRKDSSSEETSSSESDFSSDSSSSTSSSEEERRKKKKSKKSKSKKHKKFNIIRKYSKKKTKKKLLRYDCSKSK